MQVISQVPSAASAIASAVPGYFVTSNHAGPAPASALQHMGIMPTSEQQWQKQQPALLPHPGVMPQPPGPQQPVPLQAASAGQGPVQSASAAAAMQPPQPPGQPESTACNVEPFSLLQVLCSTYLPMHVETSVSQQASDMALGLASMAQLSSAVQNAPPAAHTLHMLHGLYSARFQTV